MGALKREAKRDTATTRTATARTPTIRRAHARAGVDHGPRVQNHAALERVAEAATRAMRIGHIHTTRTRHTDTARTGTLRMDTIRGGADDN